MKKLGWMSAVGLVIGLAAAGAGKANAASAADWAGPYVGATVGATWLYGDVGTSVCNTSVASCYWPAYGVDNGAVVSAAGSGSLSGTSINAGVQIGYNWALGSSIVAGVEADLSAFPVDETRQVRVGYVVAPVVGADITHKVETDYLATVRGRLGFVQGNVMPYVTAGVAYGDVKTTYHYGEYGFGSPAPCAGGPSNNYCANASDETHWGWTLGAGAEVELTKKWTLKAEYLYVAFDDNHKRADLLNGAGTGVVGAPTYPQSVDFDADPSFATMRVGFNYRF